MLRSGGEENRPLAETRTVLDKGKRPRLHRRERTTSAKAIYRDLQQQIVTMTLKPGTALGEQMLADRYGVSRTPVREAVIRLSEERLVDVLPQQGTFVSRLDIALIPEAVVIRQALEGATVQEAARVATAADINLLDDVLAEQGLFCVRFLFVCFLGVVVAFLV